MPVPRRRPVRAALTTALVATAVSLLLPAAPAVAHNSLRSASPAQDARLTAAPTEVTLKFLEALKPAFTTIVLSDSGGRKVAAGEPAITGAAVTLPITGVLPNGLYTVAYRVVSADGHPVQGSYRFTVADPAAPAAPPAASPSATPPAASPTTTAAQSSGATGAKPLVVVGIVLAALAVGAVALLRRRRRLR